MNIYTEKEDYTELRIKTPTVDTIFLFDKDIAKQMEKMGNWTYNSIVPHTLRCKTKNIDVYVRKYFSLGFPKIIQNGKNKIVDFRKCKTNDYRSQMNSKELRTRIKTTNEITKKTKSNNLNNNSTNIIQSSIKNTHNEKTSFIILAKEHLYMLLKEFTSNEKDLIFITQSINEQKIETTATDLNKRIQLEEIILVD